MKNVKTLVKENKVMVKKVAIGVGVTGLTVAGIVLYKKGFFSLPVEELVRSTTEVAEVAADTAEVAAEVVA